MASETTRLCPHGRMKRACDRCEMLAEITALRAALDQERGKVERLRAFAWAINPRDRDVGDFAKDAVDWIRSVMAVHGLLGSDGNPTALLSGRGEVSDE